MKGSVSFREQPNQHNDINIHRILVPEMLGKASQGLGYMLLHGGRGDMKSLRDLPILHFLETAHLENLPATRRQVTYDQIDLLPQFLI